MRGTFFAEVPIIRLIRFSHQFWGSSFQEKTIMFGFLKYTCDWAIITLNLQVAGTHE